MTRAPEALLSRMFSPPLEILSVKGGIFVSFIPCAQACRYQSDGYCTLTHVTALQATHGAACIYWRSEDTLKLEQRGQSFPDVGYADDL